MASLVLSFDGEMVQEYPITKAHMSIGRRPDNDIAIDNLAVSGNHAMIVRRGKNVLVEDGGSTNGTLVNGRAIEKHALQDGDVIEIGRFHLKFFEGETTHIESILEKTMLIRSPFAGKQLDPEATPIDAPTNVEPFPITFSPELQTHPAADMPAALLAGHQAVLKVLNGKHAGVKITLDKPLTSIGQKGVQIAIITRHNNSYFLNHVQGRFPIVNGATINDKSCPLTAQDLIEFSGVKMRFVVA